VTTSRLLISGVSVSAAVVARFMLTARSRVLVASLLSATLIASLASRLDAQYELPAATQLDNIADAIAGQQRMIHELENVLRNGNSPFGNKPLTPEELANLTRDLSEKQQRVRDLQNQATNLRDKIDASRKRPTQNTRQPDLSSSPGNGTAPNAPPNSRRTRPIDLPDAPGGTRPPRIPGGSNALDTARDVFRGARGLKAIVPTPLDVAIDGSIVILSEEVDSILAINEAHDNEATAQDARERLDQRIRDEVREMHADPDRRQALNPVYTLEELQTLAVINSHQGNDILTQLVTPESREALVENLNSMTADAVDWRAEVRENLTAQLSDGLTTLGDVGLVVGEVVVDRLEQQARDYVFGDEKRLEKTITSEAMDLLEDWANKDSAQDSATGSESTPPAGEESTSSAAGASGGENPGGQPADPGPVQLPSANELIQFVGQFLPPPADSLPERPDVDERPLHPPGEELIGGVPGSGEELCGGYPFNLPAAVNAERPGTINFGDIDVEAIRNGLAQTIAEMSARANFRTDADREQASRLEGDLRAAEEAWRRRVEQYNRMVQEQINEALLEEQRRRVQAAYNLLQAQHQNFNSYYQQHTPVPQGGAGKQTPIINDH
jgi:hypothetical protein